MKTKEWQSSQISLEKKTARESKRFDRKKKRNSECHSSNSRTSMQQLHGWSQQGGRCYWHCIEQSTIQGGTGDLLFTSLVTVLYMLGQFSVYFKFLTDIPISLINALFLWATINKANKIWRYASKRIYFIYLFILHFELTNLQIIKLFEIKYSYA